MNTSADVLREIMLRTGTSQARLSRLSGIRQPSISQMLSGRVSASDEQLDRLLVCMGYRLRVTREPVIPNLTRSERRSWSLHRRVSERLTQPMLEEWRPIIGQNLARLADAVQGEPHTRNLRRWRSLVDGSQLLALHRVLTGLDRDSIEMREVSPMGGLLNDEDRADALATAG